MISSLRLLNFRCFEAASLKLLPEGAVIVGANAQGKTSILESACILIRLHSPRSLRMGKILKIDTSSFGVAGECWGEERQVRFHSRKGVEMKIDDEPVSKQGEYLTGGGLVVWMGNDDLELVRGGGKIRRRYLDFLGCQLDPAYRDHLNRYQRVLKLRNLLLKDRILRDQEISVYSKLLIKHGDFVTSARLALVELLFPEIVASQLAISGSNEYVGIKYISGAGDDFQVSLEMTYEKERRLGQTIVGPHRDELGLTINGMVAADFASEGQQRTLALSMKLAQGELLKKKAGKMPVYLLDDIFGELDPDRRNALMKALPKQSQKIITTTNIDWMKGDFEVLQIESLGH